MQPILTSPDGGKKVNALGIPMVIRLHGRDTGGVLSAVETHGVPGGGWQTPTGRSTWIWRRDAPGSAWVGHRTAATVEVRRPAPEFDFASQRARMSP